MYVGYFITDRKGVITYINDTIKKRGGFKEAELIGRNIIDLFPFDEIKKVKRAIDKVKNNEMVKFESKFLNKKNETLTLIFSVSPLVTEYGEYNGMQATTTDVTLLNETREKLQYHIEFEKKIIEISSSFINLQFSEIDKAVLNALNIIGHFNNEERLIIYILNSDHSSFYKSYEWLPLKKSRVDLYPDEINIKKTGYILNTLTKKEIVYFPDLTKLRADDRDKILYTGNTGTSSCLIIPLLIKNDMLGFIHIDSVLPRHRTEAERSLFKMAAGIIATTI